eukprot:5109829-Pleurochrysis_carterae.AAC.1
MRRRHLVSRAAPHDGLASAHAGVILSPTHRPPVSPVGAAAAAWMARRRPRAGYRPLAGRGRGVATQWPHSEGSTVHRIAPLVAGRAR